LSRPSCSQCLRPLNNCICGCVHHVKHQTPIGILQHPSEQKQSKGTALLTHLCLENAKLWQTEVIEEQRIEQWIARAPTFLLYPTQHSDPQPPVMAEPDLSRLYPEFQVLILDGTWRKTIKIMALNPILQDLPKIQLSSVPSSSYRIRKQKQEGLLSTIEATAYLLQDLEPQNKEISFLLKAFEDFQQQLEQFRPQS